ncbi:hypothetical protein NQZ68_014027 [Dissostichus eleginoides]|nr:hypothetical protein NQZ68_014027 [Dissostichus eleginoides]
MAVVIMNGQKQWTRVAVMALLVITVMAGEGGKAEKQGKKERKSDCGDWQWSVCVANEGDCGLGTREGTRTGIDCKQTIKTQRCKIPCNWKKKFGEPPVTIDVSNQLWHDEIGSKPEARDLTGEEPDIRDIIELEACFH